MTSELLVDTVDNIASAIIKQMEPGPNIIEIKNDVSIMILKKDTGREMLRKISVLPDNEKGATDVRLLPRMAGNMTSTKNNFYSLQVSEVGHAIATSRNCYTFFFYNCGRPRRIC